MTDAQIFNVTTADGTHELRRVISICEEIGPWCLIGGLAVNCYLEEPRFTRDADIVVTAAYIGALVERFKSEGFKVTEHAHTINVVGVSRVFFQITKGSEYEDYPVRAKETVLWGLKVKVCSLQDLVASKVRAASDPARRRGKRLQDLSDLDFLSTEYPSIAHLVPDISVSLGEKEVKQSLLRPVERS